MIQSAGILEISTKNQTVYSQKTPICTNNEPKTDAYLQKTPILKISVREIITNYYLPEKKQRRQPNTIYGYTSSFNLHVIPRFGELPLTDITRDDVQAWVDALAVEVGAGGAWKAFKCLRQVVNWSIRKWALFIANPTIGIEKPRMKQTAPETLTQRRLKRLIRGMVGCEFEATFILSAALGLRPSESLYLHWSHINWRTGLVRIVGSLHELPSGVYEAPTKTAKSEREVYLPPWALDRLHQLWIDAGRPRARIIGDAKPSKVKRVIKRWIALNKLPRVSMKNLRHTWATIAAASGVPIEHTAAMLGHSNIQTCYRYYLAITKATMRRAQKRIARTLLGKCDDMYRGVVQPREQMPLAA